MQTVPKANLSAILAMFGVLTGAVSCGRQPPAAAPMVSQQDVAVESASDGLIASPEPDWPQWRGPRRDGISDEKGLLSDWPEGGPRLVWKVSGLGHGWSSPIIVRDRLYVTGDVDNDLRIFAFDINGQPLWQSKNGAAWTGESPGARASCAYSEGKLYHMNAHGRVACLDAATGKELWAVNVLERFQGENITWAISECLLVDGPRLIVSPGGAKALIAALDKHNGQTLWTTKPLEGDHAGYSSPILFRYSGRRILANCSSAHGYGVDAETGKLLWTVPLRNSFGTNATTPVYGDGSIFYVTAFAFGTCYHLRAGEAGFLPEKVWTTTLDSCTGAVILVDGLLYGSGYEKHKSWLCLDWQSGEVRYEFKGLKTSSAVYADGRLYCLAEDGQVASLKVTGQQCQIVSQFRLVPERTNDAWAYPVVLRGRLYLRYHDVLCCYDVRAE